MAKSLLGALALASLPSALAFRNTSPFFFFSTSELLIEGHQYDVATADTIRSHITESLKGCPSRTYFVVQQEGVSSADFLDEQSTSQLAYHLGGKDKTIRSVLVIPEVVNQIEPTSIVSYLETQCGAKMLGSGVGDSPPLSRDSPRIVSVNTRAPPPKDRAKAMDNIDGWLDKAIDDYGGGEDYTVIYTTTPRTNGPADVSSQNQHTYQMEDPFSEAVQMELKRDTSLHRRATTSGEGALFEKYQFLSPGLFMGLSAMVPLLLILYVGLSAMTSLEVSYFAFSKEMGPAAQKKQ
ncbi:BIG/ATPase V1 complex, subunit S1 [Lophiotrema nucula]|uniref:Protein BIG1 n=1 Tax=Lophiotrema nucula TaxID=690887 RepID=A0A6A5YW94_9PLEO|nr:BIG/ATPase V1 complex, subunit S1 [Lophiotrema nucula]